MKTKRKKSQKGEIQYMAVVLCAVLLLESVLLGASPSSAWGQSIEILDLSQATSVVVNDLMFVMEPMFEQYDNINTFYQLAADEMMVLLDISDSDPLAFFRGVGEFYQLASVEMEHMLDFSDNFAMVPQVAG